MLTPQGSHFYHLSFPGSPTPDRVASFKQKVFLKKKDAREKMPGPHLVLKLAKEKMKRNVHKRNEKSELSWWTFKETKTTA